MRWLSVLVVCAGCRQVLGIDGADLDPDAQLGKDTGDGAPPHDEDGDGIGDLADDCPNVADLPQRDGDGDTVGDACDPSSMTMQELALFVPFSPPGQIPQIGGGGTYLDDHVHLDGDDLTTRDQLTPIRSSVVLAAAQFTDPAAQTLELIHGIYHCRIDECAGGGWCLHAVGNNGAVAEAPFVVAPALRLEMDLTTSAVTCRAVTTAALSVDTAVGLLPSDRVRVRSVGVPVDVTSLAIYRTR